MIYLFAASFIGYCMLYLALDLYDASEAPLIVCVQIVLITYFVSLFARINIISDLLFYGGFAALAAGIVIKRRDLKSLLTGLASPAFVFFLVFCIVLYALCVEAVCVYPDEIAHYGLLPKYLLSYDRIPVPGSVVELINYPPGTALLQYYTARYNGGGQGMVFFGQMLLYASLLTVVLKNSTWKKFSCGIIAVALAVAVLFKFREYNFISLYTDQIAAMSGFFIAASFLRSDKSAKDIIKLVPVVFFTPLIRESGISYAVFGSALILVYALYTRQNGTGAEGSRIHVWVRRHCLQLCAALLIITAFLSYKIWNLHVDTFRIKTYRSLITFPAVMQGLKKFVIAIYDVLNSSIQESIVDSPGGWAMITTPAGAALLLIALSLFINIIQKFAGRDDRRIRAVCLAVFIELIIYTIGLAFSYSYTFRPTEYLAAFPRYMGGITVYCGLVVTLLLATALEKLEKGSLQSTIARSAAVALILMLFISTYPIKYNLYISRATRNAQMEEMDRRTAGLRGILEPDDKVYQIWQHDFNINESFNICRYSLMVTTNTWGWVIGTPYSQDDSITMPYTADDWANKLVSENFDYVFLGSTNKNLWNIYGGMFNIVNDPDVTVYKVTPGGEYLLTAWDTERNAPYGGS